jgi:hypothetical protein
MFHPITIATVLGIILCTVGVANAATYCAQYVGGHKGARGQCHFSTLAVAQASDIGAADIATN